MASISKEYTEANTLYMWQSYEDSEEPVTVYEYYRMLTLTIGSNIKKLDFYNSLYGESALNDGGFSEQEMDTSPIIKDGRTYLPVRYLAESFGYGVSWDATTQTVDTVSKNSIDGTYAKDVVSIFEDICAVALYETDFTALNRDFVDIESAVIVFRDGRSVNVTDSFVNATDELEAVFLDYGIGLDVAYAGKVEYDFSPEENKHFQVQIKVNVADKEGNTGYQTYVFEVNISYGEGGYL